MATDYGNKSIVTDGLVFAIDAANKQSYPGSGTTSYNIIGSNFNGTFANDVAFNGSSPSNFEFGLDGVDDYIGFGEASTSTFTSSLDPQLNSYTANIIFEMDIDSSTQVIFSKGNAGSNHIGWLMYYNPTYDKVYMRCCGEHLNSAQRASIEYPIDKNRIYMATLVIDRENNQFLGYLDGVNTQGSDNITGFNSMIAPKPLLIGIRDDNALAFDGKVYLAQIYNKALSASEVAQNYNALKSRFE